MEGWRCACFVAQVCSLTGGHTLRPVGNEVTGSPVSVSAREFHSAVTREGYSAYRFFLLQIKMALPDIGNLHFCDIADTLAGESFQQHGALQIISIGRAVIYFSHYFSIQSAASDSDVKHAAWKCRLKAGTGFPGARRFSDQSHSNIAEAIFGAGCAMINLFCSIRCEKYYCSLFIIMCAFLYTLY